MRQRVSPARAAELPGDPPAPPSPACRPVPRGGQGLGTAQFSLCRCLRWVFYLEVFLL